MYNNGLKSCGSRISHRVICVISHNPRIKLGAMCAISYIPSILHEELYGKYLNFNYSRGMLGLRAAVWSKILIINGEHPG